MTNEEKHKLMDTFRDNWNYFLNFPLFAIDFLTLSFEEIREVLSRFQSVLYPTRCLFFPRLKECCHFIKIKEWKQRQNPYGGPNIQIGVCEFSETGIIKEFYFSQMTHAHRFNDFGYYGNTRFGGADLYIKSEMDIFTSSSYPVVKETNPNLLFNSKNFNQEFFFEFYILGNWENKTSSRQVPFFSFFSGNACDKEAALKKSITKTKFIILSLVRTFPSHLFSMPWELDTCNFQYRNGREILELFTLVYNQEFQTIVESMFKKEEIEIKKNQITITLPYKDWMNLKN